MADPETDRQRAIDEFVDRLTRIRADAGDPSFRQMAKRSGAISHATMHDAVQGVRLPSWETTVEFAKACGADPEELRPEWERAEAVVHPTDQESVEQDDDTTVEATAASGPARSAQPSPEEEGEGGTDGSRDKSKSPFKLAAVAVVALAVIVAAGVGIRQLAGGSAEAGPKGGASSSTPPAAKASSKNQVTYPPISKDLVTTTTDAQGCPANAKHNRPQRSARVKGDSGSVEDLSVPDCSVQKRGAQLTKRFKLINKGSVDWVGRKLVRIERDTTAPGCRMPNEVMVPRIKAGKSAVVEIPVTAPDRKEICFARWMQMDADNKWAFPDQRPYYLSFRTK